MVLDYISNHYDIWKITSLYGVSDIAKSEVITTTRNLQIYFKLVDDFYYKKYSGMNYFSTPIIFLRKVWMINFVIKGSNNYDMYIDISYHNNFV